MNEYLSSDENSKEFLALPKKAMSDSDLDAST
jgi:hypothetical protein